MEKTAELKRRAFIFQDAFPVVAIPARSARNGWFREEQEADFEMEMKKYVTSSDHEVRFLYKCPPPTQTHPLISLCFAQQLAMLYAFRTEFKLSISNIPYLLDVPVRTRSSASQQEICILQFPRAVLAQTFVNETTCTPTVLLPILTFIRKSPLCKTTDTITIIILPPASQFLPSLHFCTTVLQFPNLQHTNYLVFRLRCCVLVKFLKEFREV